MPKIQLTPRQVLEYIIKGIANGKYKEVILIAQNCIDQIDAQEKTNQPPDSDTKKPS